MASDKELSDFLKSVERRAFKRVAYAVRDDDAAPHTVQNAIIRNNDDGSLLCVQIQLYRANEAEQKDRPIPSDGPSCIGSSGW